MRWAWEVVRSLIEIQQKEKKLVVNDVNMRPLATKVRIASRLTGMKKTKRLTEQASRWRRQRCGERPVGERTDNNAAHVYADGMHLKQLSVFETETVSR